MPRPISAHIHLSALRHNYQIARQYAGSAKVWAVVKANAYGHGLQFAIEAFADADGLALVEVDGALHIRASGWSKPILLMEGFFEAADLPGIVEHGIEVTVHCIEQIEILEQYCQTIGVPAASINVHLKVNGGMNRLGFRPEAIAAAHGRLCAITAVQVTELIMHFANADDQYNARLSVAEQLRRFEQARAALSPAQLGVSVANSAANLLVKSLASDWVRAGIMLYGGSASVDNAADFGLLPAMTLRSELIAVQTIAAGESVGYGSRFIADKPMRIGVVACGYADGYPRHAPDGTPMLVDGFRTRLVGRVSMDMLTVDITDIAQAKVGSTVTLWGRGLPIDDVARPSDTIGYELMCAIAQRVSLLVLD